MYQTVSYASQDEWDMSDNDSLTAAADADDPNMDDFYQRVVLSDDGDFFLIRRMGPLRILIVADLDGDMSVEEDYCDSNDRNMLENVDFADSDVWSVMDFDSYSSDVNEEDSYNSNMGSVADLDRDTHDRRLCLLCPDGTEDLRDLRGGSVDDHRMDHSRTVSWDPGIADSLTLLVCYDCLCLMTLFRTVIYLASYWAVRYGLGLMRGLAVQWPERNGIYCGYIHPVPWICYMVIRRRSKCLDLSL